MLKLTYPEDFPQEAKSFLNDVINEVNAGKQDAIILPMNVVVKEVQDAI